MGKIVSNWLNMPQTKDTVFFQLLENNYENLIIYATAEKWTSTRLHKNRFSSFITAMHLLQLSCNKELIPLKKVKNNTLTFHSPDDRTRSIQGEILHKIQCCFLLYPLDICIYRIKQNMKICKNNLKKVEQPRDCYNFFVLF